MGGSEISVSFNKLFCNLVGMYLVVKLFYVPTVNKVLVINGVFLLDKTPQRKSQEFSRISKPSKAELVSLQFTENLPKSSKYLQNIWLGVQL